MDHPEGFRESSDKVFINLKDLCMVLNSLQDSGMKDFTIMWSNLALKEACSMPTCILSFYELPYILIVIYGWYSAEESWYETSSWCEI